jgi:hypothetical protein
MTAASEAMPLGILGPPAPKCILVFLAVLTDHKDTDIKEKLIRTFSHVSDSVRFRSSSPKLEKLDGLRWYREKSFQVWHMAHKMASLSSNYNLSLFPLIKTHQKVRHCWLMPVILATQEAEIRRV